MKRLARRVMSRAKGAREFWQDMSRYYRFSTPAGVDALSSLTGRQLECQVTKDYHRIEKGLSLRDPRRPFGASVKQRLDITIPRAPESSAYRAYAGEARQALAQWNDGHEIDPVVSRSLAQLDGAEIDRADLERFFRSRRSVRSFREEPVSSDLVAEAVLLAINTPSVCNRQSWRAHYYSGSEAQAVLALQNGSKSFSRGIPAVLVVTVDNAMFSGSGERNQRWVDGGLFAMSLVWALHGLGLGTCMLNWSRVNSASDQLRRVGSIDTSEEIVVMIGMGWPDADARVARSARRDLVDVLVVHD